MEAKKREIGRSDKRKKCLDLDHNDHSDQRYRHHHCHYDFSLLKRMSAVLWSDYSQAQVLESGFFKFVLN